MKLIVSALFCIALGLFAILLAGQVVPAPRPKKEKPVAVIPAPAAPHTQSKDIPESPPGQSRNFVFAFFAFIGGIVSGILWQTVFRRRKKPPDIF